MAKNFILMRQIAVKTPPHEVVFQTLLVFPHKFYTHVCWPLYTQACRGGKFDYGVEMETTDAPDENPITETELKQIMESQVRFWGACMCDTGYSLASRYSSGYT